MCLIWTLIIELTMTHTNVQNVDPRITRELLVMLQMLSIDYDFECLAKEQKQNKSSQEMVRVVNKISIHVKINGPFILKTQPFKEFWDENAHLLSAWSFKHLAPPVTSFQLRKGVQEQLGANQVKLQQQLLNLLDRTSFSLCLFFLLGVKSPGLSPTLEGSVQNLELKFCSRATVKCASGTVGAVKVCARTPGVCSCALLKLYCLCRRERLGLTRFLFYLLYVTLLYTPLSVLSCLLLRLSILILVLLQLCDSIAALSWGAVTGFWPSLWWQRCYWNKCHSTKFTRSHCTHDVRWIETHHSCQYRDRKFCHVQCSFRNVGKDV